MAQYLFIDGAFFESIFSPMVTYMFPEEELFTAIDLTNLTAGYDRVFYYDALPVKKASESETHWQLRRDHKEALFNKLSMSPNLHVRSGISRYRRRRGLEQKGVDILLAIEALQHATLGNIDVACFMLSDLDFYPVFDALVQTRVKSTLYYHPHKTSTDLIHAADVAEALTAGTLNRWLRPDLSRGTRLSLRRGPYTEQFSDQQTAQCGGRSIVIGKIQGADYYIAYYEGVNDEYGVSGTIPYMVLSMFEKSPGLKVTGAERFGFP
jgi:uncharacterized LabA/DUF88 family protein